MRLIILLFIYLTITNRIISQNLAPSTSFEGYLEPYLIVDLSQPASDQRPNFLYSYNKQNEVNINLAYLKVSYVDSNTRASLAFMAGTYANANMINEPGLLKNIMEAAVGIKLLRSKELWMDVGVFPSHIGFESAVGKDCWNLTRSIAADNSPYFESGIKMTYTSQNQKWITKILLLNGWQRISRPPGSYTPALGHQLTYQPSEHLVFNSSSFVGNDYPSASRKMRYFHNFYSQLRIRNKLYLTSGIDIGAEQTAKRSTSYHFWYAPIVIIKYIPKKKWAISLRGELYSDKSQVIVKTLTPNGFHTTGLSTNIDWEITDLALWRLEFRGFYSREPIFTSTNYHMNGAINTSISVRFNRHTTQH